MAGVAAFFAFLLIVGLVWVVWASHRTFHPIRYLSSITPAVWNLPVEAVSLRTADGVRLSAWFIRKPEAQGVLLLLHGYGASKVDLLDLAAAFHRTASYHLFLFDSRGHGDSGGAKVTFGQREVLDIRAALDFLAQDTSARNLPVGCLGVSMGGAVGLLAAARFTEIQAVATDSTYADLGKAVARIQRLTYHIPRIPLGQGVVWVVGLQLGCNLRDLNPLRWVSTLAPRPVLIIHGTADIVIPPDEARALFAAAAPPKDLWLVEGAEHAGAFYRSSEEYTKRVMGFFQNAFSGRTP